jgi:hypothetical protein
MGHKQWRHRCDIKNNITKPNERAHIDLLHTEIEQQFELGTADLPVGDQTLLSYNILHLLDKSLAYKKGWLTRIWAARQRAHRIAAQDNELVLQSKAASQVYQWCLHHKDPPPFRKRKRHQDQAMEEDSDADSTPDQKRGEKGTGNDDWAPTDTTPTDMQYINDNEYCAHILVEQLPAPGQPLLTECHNSNHLWPTNTTANSTPGFTPLVGTSDSYMERFATQPKHKQGDRPHHQDLRP